MNCDAFRLSAPRYLDEDLSERKRREFENHRASCQLCDDWMRSFRKTIRILGEVLSELSPEDMENLVGDENRIWAGKSDLLLHGLGRESRRFRLVEALRNRTPEMEKKLEDLKEEARRIAGRKDMVWHQLVHSLATLGRSSGWEKLVAERDLLDSISYDALSKLGRTEREERIDKVMRQANVAYHNRKTKQLLENYYKIESLGGAEAATRKALALSTCERKKKFMRKFTGIGEKYERNIWMDLYDPDFRGTLAIDARVKAITKTLGWSFEDNQYAEHEAFYRAISAEAGIDLWELDRLLFQFNDHFRKAIEGPALGP